MKLLFDQNISHRLIQRIDHIFPEASQVSLLGLENNSDKAIWKYAKDNEWIIVTFDVDFYNMSLVWGAPPKIVWLRTLDQSTDALIQLMEAHAENIRKFNNDRELNCLEIIQGSS